MIDGCNFKLSQRWRTVMDLPLPLKTVIGLLHDNNDGKKLQ